MYPVVNFFYQSLNNERNWYSRNIHVIFQYWFGKLCIIAVKYFLALREEIFLLQLSKVHMQKINEYDMNHMIYFNLIKTSLNI